MMPPWTVWLTLAVLFGVCVWGWLTRNHVDELAGPERRALDALARIARRRQ